MKKLLLFVLNLVALNVFAQQPQLLQERMYKPNQGVADIKASAVDRNGNVFYSGSNIVGSGNYTNTFLLVKPNADTLWTRRNPVPLAADYQSVLALKSGHYVTGGNSANQSDFNIELQQLDQFGSSVWAKKNNSTHNLVTAMLKFPGNGFLLGGSYIRFNNFSFMRTDSLGNFLWNKDYTWSMHDRLVDMKFTSKGNIIAAGLTITPQLRANIKLMLVNQSGDSINAKQLSNLPGSMTLTHNSITPLSDGGFLITATADTLATSLPPGTNVGSGMVVKVDSSLNIQWHYIYRSPNIRLIFTKAKELTDGSTLVLGFDFLWLSGASTNQFHIYHFSPVGQLLNVYPFTSSLFTQVRAITFDALADSTFMIGGRCHTPTALGLYVAKVKIPGLPTVVPPFNIPNLTGTKEETLLAGTSLGQSYPNPTAAEAIIPYSLPKNYSKASIIIREIATSRQIRKCDLKPNSSSLTVDVSNLSSGLYLYSLVVDEKPVATKKLAVMK